MICKIQKMNISLERNGEELKVYKDKKEEK
jgi:hypothetical protein